ncbi:MAG: alpha/beta hydrolase, partial [Pirellulaceae bacterium]|nr:alpha/beta hydrolase [Pirellulaceae bacterium]
MNHLLVKLLAIVALITSTGAAWAQEKKGDKTPAALAGSRAEMYQQVGDVKLNLYIFTPKEKSSEPRPAAIFFFGGGWVGGTPTQFADHCRYLTSRGMIAAVADYRVAKRHKTTPFECVKDGKAAVRYLRANARRLGIDPNRIAAGGGSAGGHVAAATGNVPGLEEDGQDLKVSSRPNALLLFNPVYDNGPKGYGYSRVKDRYKEISPMHNLQKGAPPTIVFLGDMDKLIPVATGEQYKSLMEKAGSRCDLHIYKGQPHGFFNKSRSEKHYRLTVHAMDEFLVSLG